MVLPAAALALVAVPEIVAGTSAVVVSTKEPKAITGFQ